METGPGCAVVQATEVDGVDKAEAGDVWEAEMSLTVTGYQSEEKGGVQGKRQVFGDPVGQELPTGQGLRAVPAEMPPGGQGLGAWGTLGVTRSRQVAPWGEACREGEPSTESRSSHPSGMRPSLLSVDARGQTILCGGAS